MSLTTVSAPAQSNRSAEATDSERAAAQVLFDEARALASSEQWELACDKFAESLRLDRAMGTQLNLANCYEKIGKTASAWINFVEVKSRAAKAGLEEREKLAADRAAALEPKLARLRVDIPTSIDGLKITRDGEEVGSAQHGVPVPVDPGSHLIEATAPGKKSWSKKIKVGPGERGRVTVPRLRDAPKAPKPDPGTPPGEESTDDGSGMRAAGYVMTGLGVIGLAVGVTGGALAISRNDSSVARCVPDDATMCTASGVDLRNEAFNMSYLSTGGFAVAGVGFVTALALLVAAPSDTDDDDEDSSSTDVVKRWQVVPTMDRHTLAPNGLSIGGTF